MSVLVVGCGNTLRGDDALGIRVVEELSTALLPPGVDTLACQQYTPELAAELAHYDKVLFVDAQAPAAEPGNFPGRICLTEVGPVETISATGITHDMDVCGLLNLTKALYGSSPRAAVLTAEAASFDLSESLSPQIQAVISGLVTLTKRYCFSDF